MAEAEPGQDMDGDLKNEESTKSPMETSNQKETCSGIDQQGPEASRVTIEKNELEELPRERFQELWKAQDKYIDHLEEQIQELRSKVSQPLDPAKRDQLLVVRLSNKEQEIQELSNQVSELKAAQAPSTTQLRSTLVDPAVNIIITKLRQELEDTKKKLQDTQEELSAWKFTPDSATGKRLMSKCRQLLQENEDIGKMISSGRLNKLENELAMQKALCEEMKKNQEEMDDFVQELDLDVEGMQSTIYFLQQQLKDAKKTIADYESGSAGKKEDGGERELKRDNDQTDSISPKRARTDLGDQAIAVDAVSNE